MMMQCRNCGESASLLDWIIVSDLGGKCPNCGAYCPWKWKESPGDECSGLSDGQLKRIIDGEAKSIDPFNTTTLPTREQAMLELDRRRKVT